MDLKEEKQQILWVMNIIFCVQEIGVYNNITFKILWTALLTHTGIHTNLIVMHLSFPQERKVQLKCVEWFDRNIICLSENYLFETKVSVIRCFSLQLRNTSVITAADCASGFNICKKIVCLTDTVTVFCGVFVRVIKL